MNERKPYDISDPIHKTLTPLVSQILMPDNVTDVEVADARRWAKNVKSWELDEKPALLDAQVEKKMNQVRVSLNVFFALSFSSFLLIVRLFLCSEK